MKQIYFASHTIAVYDTRYSQSHLSIEGKHIYRKIIELQSNADV